MSARILITGGAGFLGSALTRALCERHPVVLLDNLRRNALKFSGLLDHPRVTLVRGDVLDPQAVAAALQGCRLVVHLASVAGVDAVESDPVGTMRVILLGAANLLQACRQAGGIERVLLVSSSEVYGPSARNVDEQAACPPCQIGSLRWSYAASKLAAEHLGLACRRQFDLPVCIARPFNVYGPGQVGQGAVHTLVERALGGLPFQLHNGGGQVRAWCYIDDLVDGFQRLLFEPAAVGEVFNLGNPASAVSVRELSRMIAGLTGHAHPAVEVARAGPDVSVRIPDISKARRLLGFTPRVELEEGLLRTVEWYRSLPKPKPRPAGPDAPPLRAPAAESLPGRS